MARFQCLAKYSKSWEVSVTYVEMIPQLHKIRSVSQGHGLLAGIVISGRREYLLYQCIYAFALLLPPFVAKLSHFPVLNGAKSIVLATMKLSGESCSQQWN